MSELARGSPTSPDRGMPSGEQFSRDGLSRANVRVNGLHYVPRFRLQRLPLGLKRSFELFLQLFPGAGEVRLFRRGFLLQAGERFGVLRLDSLEPLLM